MANASNSRTRELPLSEPVVGQAEQLAHDRRSGRLLGQRTQQRPRLRRTVSRERPSRLAQAANRAGPRETLRAQQRAPAPQDRWAGSLRPWPRTTGPAVPDALACPDAAPMTGFAPRPAGGLLPRAVPRPASVRTSSERSQRSGSNGGGRPRSICLDDALPRSAGLSSASRSAPRRATLPHTLGAPAGPAPRGVSCAPGAAFRHAFPAALSAARAASSSAGALPGLEAGLRKTPCAAG